MSDLLDPLPPVLSHSTLNLLAGASGVGKTSLVAYMTRCFLKGESLFGHMPNPLAAVGYLGADHQWDGDTQLWFEAYGIPDIPHYSLVGDLSFPLSRFNLTRPGIHAEIFAEILDTKLKLPPNSLLFADPVALFAGGDMNNYTKMALGFMGLSRLLIPRQITVIGVDHSSKQKADPNSRYTRLQERIGGSMAKLGFTSTQMYLASPEEMGEDCHTFLWNPHHAPQQIFKLRQSPDTGIFTPLESGPSAHEELAPDLAAMFAQFPETSTGITTGQVLLLYADTSESTIRRRLKSLHSLGLLKQPKHGLWLKAKLSV